MLAIIIIVGILWLFCFLGFFFFFLWSHWATFGILVPRPGIKLGATAVKALNPNHSTARELPIIIVIVVVVITTTTTIST